MRSLYAGKGRKAVPDGCAVIPANQDGVDPTAIGREFATTVTANITTSELEASPRRRSID